MLSIEIGKLALSYLHNSSDLELEKLNADFVFTTARVTTLTALSVAQSADCASLFVAEAHSHGNMQGALLVPFL